MSKLESTIAILILVAMLATIFYFVPAAMICSDRDASDYLAWGDDR